MCELSDPYTAVVLLPVESICVGVSSLPSGRVIAGCAAADAASITRIEGWDEHRSMHAEISLNTETLTLGEKFRLPAGFYREPARVKQREFQSGLCLGSGLRNSGQSTHPQRLHLRRRGFVLRNAPVAINSRSRRQPRNSNSSGQLVKHSPLHLGPRVVGQRFWNFQLFGRNLRLNENRYWATGRH